MPHGWSRAVRGGGQRRRRARHPGAAAPARVVRGGHQRHVRLPDRHRREGLPGQARHPGHGRGRPADARQAQGDDSYAHGGREEQRHAGGHSYRPHRLPVPDRSRAVHRQEHPQAALDGRRPGREGVRRTVRVRAHTDPRGSFTVFEKSRDHVSTIYHTAMPFAMFFSGGQAVHYSADFAARGYNGSSHGCVNVRDYNGIKWLFDQVSIGTSVIVYRS